MSLEQVARRAKVSTATVSRVLNNASIVRSSTRARVVQAIEELKYHPNLHARNLAGGKPPFLAKSLTRASYEEQPGCSPFARLDEITILPDTRDLAAATPQERTP